MGKKKGKKTGRSPKRAGRRILSAPAYAAPLSVVRALEALAGRRVLITAHSLADTDAVGAGLALAEFLGPQAVLALPDRANSEARRLMGAQMGRLPDFAAAKRQFPGAPVILLDCNDPSLLAQLRPKAGVFLLIDHHALSADSVRARHEWVEPQAASCSELVAALIGRPSPQTARFLVWGILSDSAHLLRADERTLGILARLLGQADASYEEMLNALRQPASVESRAAVLEGLRQAAWSAQGGRLVATAMVGSHEAHVADALVTAGADAAFAGTADKHGARISARLRPALASAIDLPALMRQVGRFVGGEGGGHSCAAGATGPKSERLGEALILARRRLERE